MARKILRSRFGLGVMGLALVGALGTVQSKDGAGDVVTSYHEKLAPMAWMWGEWVREQGGDRLEEAWLRPEGNTMIGTFRWIKGGNVWMYELMAITVEGDDVVFRLRHFDKTMTPWEEKDGALTYMLESAETSRVVFENPERDHPRRFVYEQPEPDSFVVKLQGPDADSEPTVFHFRRRKALTLYSVPAFEVEPF